jgi:integrase
MSTGNVRRRPGGGWVADVTINGRRKTAEARTKAEAMARLRELRELLATPVGQGAMTLAKARAASLAKRWHGTAYERTASIYSQAAVDWFGDVPLTEITGQSIDAWRDSLLSKGNRPATVNRKTSALRAMLVDANLRGGLPAVPSFPPQLPMNNTRDRVFTPEEERAMVNAFRQLGQPAAADLFVFLLYTAARAGEALKLVGADVVLASGRSTCLFRQTKNKSDRTIPLPTRAIEAIEPHLPALPRARVWQLSYDQFRGIFERALDLAGLAGEPITIHTTRHTCATRLASGTADAAPVPLHILQWFGGWKSLAAVSRYAHRNTEAMAHCVKVLGG